MIKKVLVLLLVLIFVSCNSEKTIYTVTLEEADSFVSFAIPTDVKNPQFGVYPFVDNGKDFLSFCNNHQNEIVIYEMTTGRLLKRIAIHTEGVDAIPGGIRGYQIQDMKHIFIPDLYQPVIYKTDTSGKISQRIHFEKTDAGQPLIPFIFTNKSPFVFIGDSLYISQTLNPFYGNKTFDESPVKIVVDTAEKSVEALPMRFPKLITFADLGTPAGFGCDFSDCYDGKTFVYSFAYDENLYKAVPRHKNILNIPAKSRYIDKINVFRTKETDVGKILKAQCEHPSYGNIMYDKYRNVYYRFAYPHTQIDDYNGDYLDLIRSGRKQFAILILDSNLNIIGEKLFPEYTYNPNLCFIIEDGLYISLNHIKNPDYSDDMLSFQRFVLTQL